MAKTKVKTSEGNVLANTSKQKVGKIAGDEDIIQIYETTKTDSTMAKQIIKDVKTHYTTEQEKHSKFSDKEKLPVAVPVLRGLFGFVIFTFYLPKYNKVEKLSPIWIIYPISVDIPQYINEN